MLASGKSSTSDTTLRELAEAVLLPGFTGTTAPDWVRARLAKGLGGVVLFGRNIVDDEQVSTLAAQLRAERDDVVIGIDEEGGDVTRLDVATGSDLPGPLALGAAGDLRLTERVGRALAGRLADCGVTVNLAPCADLNLTPDDPIIGVRAFGTEPYATAAHVGAFVRGHQRSGVAACAKHFPGHGASTSDSHMSLPVLPRTAAELREAELVPFRAAIAAGVRAVMTGHLVVPEWGDDAATLNAVAIGEVLRGELGFTGTVVTDALEMGAVAGTLGDTAGLTRAAVKALLAGADALCVGGEVADGGVVPLLVEAIIAAVADGTLSEQRLAEAADRTRALGTAPSGIASPDAADLAGLGLAVAHQALRASGRTTVSPRPLVVDIAVAPTIVSGSTPWGLTPYVADLLPECTTVRVTADEPGTVVQLARSRGEVVMATRDAHRYPAVRALVADLIAAAGTSVHVETGVPGPDLGASGRIDTFGASRAGLRAAAEFLAHPDRERP